MIYTLTEHDQYEVIILDLCVACTIAQIACMDAVNSLAQ